VETILTLLIVLPLTVFVVIALVRIQVANRTRRMERLLALGQVVWGAQVRTVPSLNSGRLAQLVVGPDGYLRLLPHGSMDASRAIRAWPKGDIEISTSVARRDLTGLQIIAIDIRSPDGSVTQFHGWGIVGVAPSLPERS
jgi:hypothetical protein